MYEDFESSVAAPQTIAPETTGAETTDHTHHKPGDGIQPSQDASAELSILYAHFDKKKIKMSKEDRADFEKTFISMSGPEKAAIMKKYDLSMKSK